MKGKSFTFLLETLLIHASRLGVDIILHLLTGTSLFLKLPNECLCQITGEPLVNLQVPSEVRLPAPLDIERDKHSCHGNALKRKGVGAHPDEPISKRARSIQTPTTTMQTRSAVPPERRRVQRASHASMMDLIVRSPVRISITRLRLLYRRPDRMSRTHKIVFGFPLKRRVPISLRQGHHKN